MNNKMLHRGSITWLTSTKSSLPVLSTCILLLIQFQTFHAHPTSTSSFSNNSGFHQTNTDSIIARASPSSTAYGSAYPYSSYQPGTRLTDSYRPYSSAYPRDFPVSFSSGLYSPESTHPNSVYSRQSSSEPSSTLSKNLDKVLKLIEKEIAASDLQQKNEKIPILFNTNDDQDATPERKQISLPISNNNTPIRNNKPRLLPLPSVQSTSSSSGTAYETNNNRKQQNQQNINDKEFPPQQSTTTFTTTTDTYATSASTGEQKSSRNAEYSPVPPPFAPELDPLYERRQYGLGSLTLLDQAGPFW